MKRKDFMEKFHEKLKVLRKKQGLTQKEVADFFGINQAVYQKWESGSRKPTYENLSMLACIFNVTIDFLLSEYLEISKERCLKFVKEVNEGEKKKILEEDELKDFCKKLPRAEFEDSERAKSVAIKAMRVVLLALGYDTDFVENEFRKEVEKVIVVKRNI
jgi:transcriptional regulator, cro/CI family